MCCNVANCVELKSSIGYTIFVLYIGKMRTILSSWLLLMACVEVSIQQCTIKGSMSKIKDRLSSITDAMITINSTYYNCLSRSDTSDHYSSMSVSILYIRSGDPNNTHEVRYNLQCNNGVWEIVGNQSTALRNNNTRYCEDCIDQTVNKYRCTSYAIGKLTMKCYMYIIATQLSISYLLFINVNSDCVYLFRSSFSIYKCTTG